MALPAIQAPSGGRRGAADVVFVLLLIQAAAGLLAAAGEVALMGTPWYAALPVIRAVVLFLLAGRVARGRRRAVLTVLVLQWLGLLGVWLGLLLGLVPGLAPSMTLAGLLTEVGLPVAVIVLCAGLLARWPVPWPGSGRLRGGPGRRYPTAHHPLQPGAAGRSTGWRAGRAR